MKKYKQRKSNHKGQYIITNNNKSIYVDIYSPINSTRENEGKVFNKNIPSIIYLNGGPGALGFPNLTKYINTRENNFLMIYYFGCHPSDTIIKLKEYGLKQVLENHTLDNFIDDVNQVINYFSIKNVRILANCFGTLIALAYANKYPKIIKQIILIEPYTNMIEDDEEYFIKTITKGKFSKNKTALLLYSKLLKTVNISNQFYTLDKFVEVLFIKIKYEIEKNKKITPCNAPTLKAYLDYILYISSSSETFLNEGVLNKFEFIRYALYELHWARKKYFLSKKNNYSLENKIINIIKQNISLKLIYNTHTAFFSPKSLDSWKRYIGEKNIMYFSSTKPGLYSNDAKDIVLKILKDKVF